MTTLLVENNDIVMEDSSPVIVTGVEAVESHLQGVVGLQLGDFGPDPDSGIDWLNILGSGIPDARIAQIVQARILADGIVQNITAIQINYDGSDRIASFDITADGTTLNIPMGADQ